MMNFPGQSLDLNTPQVMGVINVTPDSFYTKSRFTQIEDVITEVNHMVAVGASIIDVGGESTNPSLNVTESSISNDEELSRVVPIIEAIHQRFPVIISVDTSKACVMREAVNAGASMINDQRALQLPGALDAAISLKVPVCLMHMFGLNKRIEDKEPFENVLMQIKSWLLERATFCIAQGILPKNIILDPGFGHGNFGKSTRENLYLLKHLSAFCKLNYPLLVGFSRKTFIGKVTGEIVDNRLPASLAAACMAVLNGASIIRVHDVYETHQALKMVRACMHVQSENEAAYNE